MFSQIHLNVYVKFKDCFKNKEMDVFLSTDFPPPPSRLRVIQVFLCLKLKHVKLVYFSDDQPTSIPVIRLSNCLPFGYVFPFVCAFRHSAGHGKIITKLGMHVWHINVHVSQSLDSNHYVPLCPSYPSFHLENKDPQKYSNMPEFSQTYPKSWWLSNGWSRISWN